MGTTSRFAFPYPEPTSSVDVPRDVKALADAVDARAWASGRVTHTFPGNSVFAGAVVTFPPGRFPSVPDLQLTSGVSWYLVSWGTPISATSVQTWSRTVLGTNPTPAETNSVMWFACVSG
jgi:hypothetical protein